MVEQKSSMVDNYKNNGLKSFIGGHCVKQQGQGMPDSGDRGKKKTDYFLSHDYA